ncbi:MAG: HTH domain-containing protein [Eubacteriaceae bacterium]|jgi:DeoR/GlpR family transcriptional regulator of sugar metabolism|nr:HTH domain-containing protein [Eubacteriaceae bacterium]
MNKRGVNLLNDILSSEKLSVECLAKRYLVTQQTIKNDIKDINY